MKNIIIIGAGLSGALVVINLLKIKSSKTIQIMWVDRNSDKDLGSAFSTDEDYLLNVPVEKMGAFSKEPEDFLNWSRENNIPAELGDYLPRRLYRKYIHSILLNEIKKRKPNKIIKRIKGEATDINISNNKLVVSIQGAGNLTADKVVLALGNLPPKNPETKSKLYLKDIRYKSNPWKPDILKNLSENDSILFIGTGQTMVDLAVGLYRKKHKSKMIAISRHGILPMSQKNIFPYKSFYDELRNQTSLLSIFNIIRKHIKIAAEEGIDPRAVIDSLRPNTRDIWMQLDIEEKLRFLRHVFRYWEIIRSRIPLVNEKILIDLKLSGQLRIVRGRVIDITSDDLVQIKFYELNSKSIKIESVNFIVNCMGPNSDYEKIEQVLIRNLIKKKIIKCDPVHLGINSTPEGHILNNDGNPSTNLFTIGPPLRGILWESIAVPEIRLDAENLAHLLLTNL